MNIPMVDLAGQWQDLREEIEPELAAVMASGRFIQGEHVAAFEAEAARRLGVAHAIGCASGTDALQLALMAAGIGAGDEVITTPFTFFGTAEAILHAGATPVFVDIEPASFNIDVDAVAAAIGPRTRAIMPVHLYGQACDMTRLLPLAEQHGLTVIEDCAQAFGASHHGRAVGAIGAAGGFSFFPAKNLGAFGDAGMVTTDDAALAACVRELGNHGSAVRYHHTRVGFNSRLDEIQAVVLRAKLRRIDRYNAARRRLARAYHDALRDLPGVVLPVEADGNVHVWHQYTLRLQDRDAVAHALQARGIASAVHYPLPLHRQPVLQAQWQGRGFPHAEAAAAQCLSLPMYPELGEARVAEVAEAVRAAVRTTAARAVSR